MDYLVSHATLLDVSLSFILQLSMIRPRSNPKQIYFMKYGAVITWSIVSNTFRAALTGNLWGAYCEFQV